MEARISDLEREVGDLRVCNASLSTSVDHLSGNVKELTVVVQQLRDAMNQSKGALWAITGAAGIVGATAASVVHKLLG